MNTTAQDRNASIARYRTLIFDGVIRSRREIVKQTDFFAGRRDRFQNRAAQPAIRAPTRNVPSEYRFSKGLLFAYALSIPWAASTAESRPAAFGAEAVRDSVTEIATIVRREYMDPALGNRVADVLLERHKEGRYSSAHTPETLTTLVTEDLMAISRDKHLSVSLIREARLPPKSTTASSTRRDDVRETNGGVQRVEILSGNVGYLNLTTFLRIEEGRDVIADAMRLLSRADALIIDMRQNNGGSPDTVAFLAGYLFEKPGLPLFDIVSRQGTRTAYATPTSTPPDRDGRRPIFVLTAARTFSAGEGLAFILQERGRAVVIGEQTSGAANPGRPYRVNQWLEVTVPNGKIRTALGGRNWEGTGVVPDVLVPANDALQEAHARALRSLPNEMSDRKP